MSKAPISTIWMVLLFTSALCHADVSTDTARINGVVDFLLERAQQNNFYIFQEQLKDSKVLRCYFPTTYSHVKDGDLRLLLLARDMWGQSIESDIAELAARAVASEINKAIDFKNTALKEINSYLDIVQYLQVEYLGEKYPLNQIPPDSDPELKKLINGFFDEPNNLVAVLLQIDKVLKKRNEYCRSPDVTLEDLESESGNLRMAIEGLGRFRKHVATNMASVSVDQGKIEHDCRIKPSSNVCSMRGNVKEQGVLEIANNLAVPSTVALIALDALRNFSDKIPTEKSNTERALLAIQFIKQHGANPAEIEKYRRNLLFFTQISDAKTSAEVKEVLTTYTMPPVSFAVKREPYQSHYLITAYLGYGMGSAGSTAATDMSSSGIYAPIGIEASRGTGNGGSLSLTLSPFDFGYPIYLKLNGIKRDIKLEDVVTPSVYLSYGLAHYPISLGIAYQRGRKGDPTGASEERFLFVVAYDLPLYTLY